MKIKTLMARLGLFVLMGLPALGQSQFSGGGDVGAKISGNITPGDCAEFLNSTTIEDSGSACGTGGGNVTGPASSTTNDVAGFSSTTGKALLDTGILYTNLTTQTSNGAANEVCTYTGANKVCVPGTVGNSALTNSAITIAGTSVALGGSTSSFPSPGTIGGTTPGAGFFTTGSFTGNLTTNMIGGPFCVHETSGVLSATGSDCGSGGGSLPSGTQGEPLVNTTGSTTYATTPLWKDVSQYTGSDICAQIIAASSGDYPLPYVYDARAITGTSTCSISNAENTFTNMASGSTLLLGSITIKLGTSVRTNTTNCGGYSGTGGSGTSLTCVAPWIIPSRIKLVGVSPAQTAIEPDSSNWVIRSGTISSATNSGTGPGKWVHLTFSGLSAGTTPVFGELVQLQSTTGGTPDSNSGMFVVCKSGTPSQNGGCQNNPGSTTVDFYSVGANTTSNGGTVYFGTPLIAWGYDSVGVAAVTAAYAQDMVLLNLTLNTLGVQGAIGFQNPAAEEHSRMDGVTFKNMAFAGMDLLNNAGSNFTNSGPYSDLYFLQPSTNCYYGTTEVHVGNGKAGGYIRATVTNLGCNYLGYDPTAVAITSFTGTSGTLTFASANSWFAGEVVELSGFTSPNTGLNQQYVTVLSSGLTGSQFEAVVTGSGYSSGAGTVGEGKALTNVLVDGQLNTSQFQDWHTENALNGFLLGANSGVQGVQISGMDAFHEDNCINISSNFASVTGAITVQSLQSTSTNCTSNGILDNDTPNTITSANNATVNRYSIDMHGGAVGDFSTNDAGTALLSVGNIFYGYNAGTQEFKLNGLNGTASFLGNVSIGSGPPTACGSASGCIASTEASTAGTPTTGQCYIRADSTSNTYKYSCNGGAEASIGSGGGDTITSPNSTLVIGGTSTNTTLDLAGAAGEIMAGATPALTYAPTLGKPGTAGTISFFPTSGNFTATIATVATASYTINLPAAVPTGGHILYCAVSSTTCTLTDTGYAYNSIPNTDLANSAITIGGTSVSLGGSTASFPTPGAIGGTTPAAGTFTTLTANTSLTDGGLTTANAIPKNSSAGLFSESSITDNGTTVVTAEAVTGLNFTSTGTTAGFLDLPQGSTSAAVAPCNTATSICIQAPTAVTAQLRILAGTPATGFSLWTNSSGTMTETISATSGTMDAGPALLGTLAINSVIASTVANVAGHFTNLQVVTTLGGTCTTPPQFNVFDGTSNTGSTVTASASTQTKGTGTSTAQTQTFASGDIIGIYISTAGATCTTDQFIVTAQYSVP